MRKKMSFKLIIDVVNSVSDKNSYWSFVYSKCLKIKFSYAHYFILENCHNFQFYC